jgi:hypothetical protein
MGSGSNCGYLPQSLANGLQKTGQRVSKEVPCPQANGMHAWHAGSNAYLAGQLGLIGAPLIFAGGLYHESPLDWKSFQAEQYWQGSVNHLLDSATDIISNFYGMTIGYAYPGKDPVGFAMRTGNYIPGPGEPDPAFGGAGPYKGSPADAWGQYP